MPVDRMRQDRKADDSITKYTSAGQTLGEVLKKFVPSVTAGKKVLDLCIECVVSLALVAVRWKAVERRLTGQGRQARG